MLTIPGAIKIYMCAQSTDMRKSFDGLYGMVKSFMGNDPMSGQLFIFRNRRGDRIKIFSWDRDGFAIWYKKLAKGTFRFPATLVGNSVELDRATLMMILEGVDLKSARRQKRYRHGEPNAPTGSATSPEITH